MLRVGRPPRLTPAQDPAGPRLRDSGETIAEVVRTYNVSRATNYRASKATELIGAAPKIQAPTASCRCESHACGTSSSLFAVYGRFCAKSLDDVPRKGGDRGGLVDPPVRRRPGDGS